MTTRRRFLGTLASSVALTATPLKGYALPVSTSLWERLETFSGTPEAIAKNEPYWWEVQQAFTVDRSLIHLNNGGVCPAPAVVQHALHAHQEAAYKTPFYAYRGALRPQVEHVRGRLARMFGCDAEEVALTRNTSEGMEICQLGFDLKRGEEVLTTDHDYPRMLNTWHQRVRREGIVLKQVELPVPAEDPAAIVARFEEQITPRTRLIMLCHMVDVTGQILPVKAVTDMAHRYGIPVLVDGAQTFGQVDFTYADLGCDYFATSLHKWLMGPQGTGMLFVRKDRIPSLWPLMPADPKLDNDIRKFEDIGTQSIASLLAVAEALTFHQGIGAARKEARLRYLTDYWLQPLARYDRVRLHTSRKRDCACTLNTLEVDGIDSVALRDYLWNIHRIRVRPIKHPAVTGIRVSPSLYTTLNELDRFIEVMESIICYDLPV